MTTVPTAGDEERLVARLRAWLIKRAGPDSGIKFEGGSINWDTLRRDRQSRTTFYGSDAEFVTEHFHGKGAAKLLASLEALSASNAEAERLREALRQARRTMRNCAGAIQSGQIVDKEVDRNLRRGYEAIDAAIQGSAKQ